MSPPPRRGAPEPHGNGKGSRTPLGSRSRSRSPLSKSPEPRYRWMVSFPVLVVPTQLFFFQTMTVTTFKMADPKLHGKKSWNLRHYASQRCFLASMILQNDWHDNSFWPSQQPLSMNCNLLHIIPATHPTAWQTKGEFLGLVIIKLFFIQLLNTRANIASFSFPCHYHDFLSTIKVIWYDLNEPFK